MDIYEQLEPMTSLKMSMKGSFEIEYFYRDIQLENQTIEGILNALSSV